jgi:hypothetical protein
MSTEIKLDDIVRLAETMPTSTIPRPRIATEPRDCHRRSRTRTDAQTAGAVVSGPVGYGISSAGKKIKDGPDGEWLIAFRVVPPTTDAETSRVVAAIAARWTAEARRMIALLGGDWTGGDDRDIPVRDAQRAAISAALARVEVAQ